MPTVSESTGRFQISEPSGVIARLPSAGFVSDCVIPMKRPPAVASVSVSPVLTSTRSVGPLSNEKLPEM